MVQEADPADQSSENHTQLCVLAVYDARLKLFAHLWLFCM